MVIVMLIFKYFKYVAAEHKDKGLSEPTGLLIKSVPMKAIELANAKVANVTPRNNKTRPYLMLTPAQDMKLASGKQNTT